MYFISVTPEPRLGSVLARALDQKARLGSARAIFQKARVEKNWQNEPIDSTHQDKPICTLEYMVWPIRTSRNLPLKLNKKTIFFSAIAIEGYFLSKNWSKKPNQGNTKFSATIDMYSF